MKLAPAVVFAYNRPVHLQRTLDSLAANRLSSQTDVHVYSDGPRNAAASGAVDEVRRVLDREARADRFASFRVTAASENLGLATSIIRGVSQVLEHTDRVIVIEDDLLLSKDFLAFMNDCLAFYADDTAVGAVTGFCPLASLPASVQADIFLATRNSSYGWGTWPRVWEGVDWSASDAGRLAREPALRRAFNREGNDRYDRLRRQLAGRIDSWSIRFGLSLFLRGLGTIYPVVNRVGNIGYDGSGVHSGVGTPKNETVAEAPYRLQHVKVERSIQRAFHRTYSGSLPRRFFRDVLAWSPRLAGRLGR